MRKARLRKAMLDHNVWAMWLEEIEEGEGTELEVGMVAI